MFGLKLKTRDEIQSSSEKLTQEILTAEARIRDIDATRNSLLIEGTPDDLICSARTRELQVAGLEQARARLAANDRAATAREAEDEETRRRAKYDAAKKRASAGAAHLKAYDRHCELAAAELLGYLAVRQDIIAANFELPSGAKPIADLERDNSVAPTRNADNFSTWGSPHVSLLDRAVIPKVARGEYWFGGHNIKDLKR